MDMLVSLDLEASGVNTETDRIIEVGLVAPDDDLKFSFLVNPGFEISNKIQKLTGINKYELLKAPKFQFYARDLLDYLVGKTIIGHGIMKFDIPLLLTEFERVGLYWDTTKSRFIDTYTIFAKQERRNLAAALKFYCEKERDGGTSHRAMDDAEDAMEVFSGQIKLYEEDPSLTDDLMKLGILQTYSNICTSNMIDFSGKFIYNEDQIPVFNFGKSKGESVYTNSGLLRWMLDKDFSSNTKQWAQFFLEEIDNKSQSQTLEEYDLPF